MIDLPYCNQCSLIGKDGICDQCTPKLRNIWREDLPDRYRVQELSNTSVCKYLKAFADDYLAKRIIKRTGFLLYGSMGSGKSYLLSALANYIFKNTKINFRYQSSPVIWFPDQRFVSTIQWANSARGDKPMHEIIEHLALLSKNHLVIIDDVGQGTPRADVALAGYNYLIDQIYSRQGWLAIASNYKPSEMASYIGHYSVDRLRQMCGKENMFEMQGESLRK